MYNKFDSRAVLKVLNLCLPVGESETSIIQFCSVVDPGFPREWRQPLTAGAKPLFDQFSPKLKENEEILAQRLGASLAPPRSTTAMNPVIRTTRVHMVVNIAGLKCFFYLTHGIIERRWSLANSVIWSKGNNIRCNGNIQLKENQEKYLV